MQNSRLSIFVAVLVVAAVVLVFLWRPGQDGPGGDGPPNPEETKELLRLVALANRSSGALENAELQAASAGFEEIARELPTEMLGPQNLAVTKVLGFEDGKVPREEVDAALQKLQAMADDSATTHWLISRAAIKAMELEPNPEAAQLELARAIEALDRARSLEPENVVYQFARFEAGKLAAEPDEEASAALEAAYRLEPTNLFLLAEWLLLLVDRQDPEIVATLEAAKDAIAPARRSILQKNSRYDVFTFTDQAIAAAKDGKWPIAKRFVRTAYLNLLRPEDITKGDERRLHPHILEFATKELSAELLGQLSFAASDTQLIDVQFVAPVTVTAEQEVLQVRLVDLDLDERLDVLALSESRLDAFAPGEDGWRLITSIDLPAGCRGLLAADLDHDRDREVTDGEIDAFDADVDVVVFGEQGVLVLRNDVDADGQRSFSMVTQDNLSDLAAVEDGILVDFDHDSDLDLVLATETGIVTLLAEGSMQYADVSEFSQLPPADFKCSSLAAVDWDRDVDIDVVIAGSGVQAGYLENLRHGNFRWVPFADSASNLHSASVLAVLDADGNAAWDLCAAGDEGVFLTETGFVPEGGQRPMLTRQIATGPASSLLVWDYNNDSFLDVLAWGADGLQLRARVADGNYVSTDEVLSDVALPIACDIGDVDNDGDLELVTASSSGVVAWQNDGGNGNPWLKVRALGQVDNKGKVNHHGIGSLLELRGGLRYQAHTVDRPVTHFGLGPGAEPDMLRFLWTNGISQAVVSPQPNQSVCEPMELKGSCPYLYAWDGEKFGFVTDLLWAAPIGLQVAEGVLAPSRPWEYLLVRGDQLRPSASQYELRITEELWEAAYFDEVELIAVDHPNDVEVFTNEKVGPASIAQHQIHTVRERRYPLAARDQLGRDVLSAVKSRDGKYFQGFEKNRLPGLVDEHYLELELGDLTGAERIQLFLTGWIYPTDTSLNVAISQDDSETAPRPPAIWVPDSKGEWREVVPYMGFPGGKTKTIVVDLSELFLTDDYRLRIVTSAEIYWDEVFYTVDESRSELKVTPLKLESAELRYRGFSAPLPDRPRSPQVYDYDVVTRSPKWPPMKGNFTRLGDVTELLVESDERLVVLASGDEVALRFALTEPPPPPGWSRDFVLHSVGWDKDADLNTVYGQSVEPLPYVEMTGYPYAERGPTSSGFEAYIREFQTRKSGSAFWRQLLTTAP